MFEHMTFDKILSSTLEKIDDKYDKRQGSVIYDAIAPLCAELAQFYIQLDLVIKEAFADTSSRRFLLKRGLERGLTPFPATFSIILAKLDGDFSLSGNERFSLNNVNFFFTGEMDGEYFKLKCEQAGTIGNISYGDLIPIDNIDGLVSAQVFKVFYFATDEEDTETFRKRYFNSFKYEAFGGNRFDYINKIKSLNLQDDVVATGGIGACKIVRACPSGGFVNIYIINSLFKPPSEKLLELVQQKVDPITNSADGYGIAPIGHSVKILSPNVCKVDFNFNIVLQQGYTNDDIKDDVFDCINNYITSVAKNWDKQQIILRIAYIESALLNIEGVLDISNTQINGSASNLILDNFDIPEVSNIYF